MKGLNNAASVRARLLNRAKSAGTDFSLVLTRYALERLRARLQFLWVQSLSVDGQ
jgi:hypothetical protein